MHSTGDLIKIIGKSHFPFPVIVLEKVVAVFKLRWISLSLFWFESTGTSNIGIEIDVLIIEGG